MEKINLNKDNLYLHKYKSGRTSVEIRLGRKLYIADIDKDVCTAKIDFYHKMAKDRTTYSKHDPECDCTMVFVKNDATLSRKFFEDIKEIAKAQYICGYWEHVLRK